MKTLQFFFQAFVIEAFGVALVVCMLSASPADYLSTAVEVETESRPQSWFERTSKRTFAGPQSNPQAAFVENTLESTANRVSTFVSQHFDRFISETSVP